MKKQELRPVKVKQDFEESITGFFHTWGQAQSQGNIITVGVIETEYGEVITVLPSTIIFSDVNIKYPQKQPSKKEQTVIVESRMNHE